MSKEARTSTLRRERARVERVIGRAGCGEGKLCAPTAVAIGAYGTLYVTDTGNQRVQCFATDGRYLRQWNKTGGEDAGPFRPSALAVGPLAGARTDVMEEIMATALASWPPGLAPLCARYVGEEECVYVIDTQSCRVHVFSREGRWMHAWGRRGSGVGEFDEPRNCAVGADGLVYVADGGNARVQIFSPDGGYVDVCSLPGQVPLAIIPTNAGVSFLVLISDNFDEGIFVCQYDKMDFYEARQWAFRAEWSVAPDSISFAAHLHPTAREATIGAEHLLHPTAIDTLYITSSHYVTQYTFYESAVCIWRMDHSSVSPGSPLPPRNLCGLAVGADGLVYVADRAAHHIFVLRLSSS